MNHYSDFRSPVDSGTWIGYQDNIFRPDVSSFTLAEHGAHEVFEQRPVPVYTHQLFGEMPTQGIWNANFICSTPIAAEAFPFAGGNGDGSAAPQIFDPRSTSATHQYNPNGNDNSPPSTQSGSLSPIWVPNAINAQTERCSNSIERHTQQVFDVMPTLQGRVLSVRILHALYPVTLDMLNHVFSLYGSVENIVHTSPLTGHQVLIQYQQHQMASLALRVLQGHSLYQSCCYLEVKYALGSELQVLCPSLCVGNIFASGSTYKEHDASAMPNERVIEQPPPMQVLDEVPSVHDLKVAVQLCNSEVVQAATMARQGNPASSTPLVMHVDNLQLPTSVQDTPDLFEEMPTETIQPCDIERTTAVPNCQVYDSALAMECQKVPSVCATSNEEDCLTKSEQQPHHGIDTQSISDMLDHIQAQLKTISENLSQNLKRMNSWESKQLVATQAAAVAPVCCSKTNNTAGSETMLVHNLQESMIVQDYHNGAMKMHVSVEVKQESEQLDKCLHKASATASHEQVRIWKQQCDLEINTGCSLKLDTKTCIIEFSDATSSLPFQQEQLQQVHTQEYNLMLTAKGIQEWDPGIGTPSSMYLWLQGLKLTNLCLGYKFQN